MKTLFLHIGTMKTGTSFLQSFLGNNRKALSKLGCVHPEMPFAGEFATAGPNRNGHFITCAERARLHGDDAQAASLLARGLAVVDGMLGDIDAVTLSDESLFKLCADDAQSVLGPVVEHASRAGYAVRVVVYLRRQDTYVASRYAQQIKAGNTYKSPREWYEEGIVELDYHKVLVAVASVVGTENVIVRTYERDRIEAAGGIHLDFLDAIGITFKGDPDELFEMGPKDVNPSLSPNLVALMRVVNSVTTNRHHDPYSVFSHAIRHCQLVDQSPKRHMVIPSAVARELIAIHAPDNARVASEFLHIDGPLFDETVEEPEPWHFDNAQMSRDVVRYFQQASRLQERVAARLAADGEGAGASGAAERPSQDDTEFLVDGGWMQWCRGTVVPEGDFEEAVREIARFFALRQRAVSAGEEVEHLSDGDVACLVREVLVRAGLGLEASLVTQNVIDVLRGEVRRLTEAQHSLEQQLDEARGASVGARLGNLPSRCIRRVLGGATS